MLVGRAMYKCIIPYAYAYVRTYVCMPVPLITTHFSLSQSELLPTYWGRLHYYKMTLELCQSQMVEHVI